MQAASSFGFFSPNQKLSPAKIVQLYAVIGVLWIIFSDTVAVWLVKDVEQFEEIGTYKGIFFILATAGFLHLLLSYYVQQLRSSQETSHLAEQEIKKLACYDRETGLPNHNLLLDRLNQVIAFNGHKGKRTAVIYISLTGLKTVVDAHGHSGGCAAVCGIAERLVAALREYDTVARIHRDEFVLVLGGTVTEEDLAVILTKLQALFAAPLRIGRNEAIIPACFGIACFPADGTTSEVLLQCAHIAMNQARQLGVPFQYYSAALDRKAAERLTIETGLRRALENGEFSLCYQPKMDINGTDIVGMEALVRWQRPGYGTISPDKFIPVAEENGLIVSLGTYVLREACRQNRAWQDTGLPKLRVAVNLSARQLRDHDFVPLVMRILTETGMDPHYLELELTESLLMGDSGETVRKLLYLKELGISIAVDDFGTGYSSLSYLKHLPIDTIKVDRSFVRDIVNDPDDAAIVDAIIAMASSLKLNVIAEGVETSEQLDFLKERKCQQVQGYYFAQPLAPREFELFLAQGEFGAQALAPLELSSGSKVAQLLPGGEEISLPAAAAHAGRALPPAEAIGDIAIAVTPANPGDNLAAVLKRFQAEPTLLVLPIVDDGQVVGIINRSTFLEEHVIGMIGFAYHINHAKKMRDLMTPIRLTLEAAVSIRDASQAIQAQEMNIRVENICVTQNGRYHGVVDVNRFISVITDINLTLAKGANPLTGLPGNESIQREINKRLRGKEGFDIAYIDIDNFKPYNDYYGFQRGDVVIKTLGEIVATMTQSSGGGTDCFCGHIGGDDFIIISGPQHAESLSARVINAFEGHLPDFHGEKDHASGCYSAINRKGEEETFRLLSLSIGIVNTRRTPVSSYAELASISTEVKKAAKRLAGSSVAINRRAGEESKAGEVQL